MAKLNVLYEDNHIIVAIKPRNTPTQADISGDMDFLTQIKEYIRVKYNKPGAVYLGMVHRLDRPAGGVMVFARTSKAAGRLSAQFREGGVYKKYYAVVAGAIPQRGVLKDYLIKDRAKNISKVVGSGVEGAKYAELSYITIDRREGASLLEVDLLTGRPHQIRVQFAYAGAPLAGDVKYGNGGLGGLGLWSCTLAFIHPTRSERMEFYCPPPVEYPFNLFSFPEKGYHIIGGQKNENP